MASPIEEGTLFLSLFLLSQSFVSITSIILAIQPDRLFLLHMIAALFGLWENVSLEKVSYQ
jgi:hypothetical protein